VRAWTTQSRRQPEHLLIRSAVALLMMTVLGTFALGPACTTPCLADEAMPGARVLISYDAHDDPPLSVQPRLVTLGLNDPGYAHWELDASAKAIGGSFAVSFTQGAPFTTTTASGQTDDRCTLGPLSGGDGTGFYDYEVTLYDHAGHPAASRAAMLEVVEHRGLPRVYIALGVLLAILFIIFAFIEGPLTRSYEESAH
jgi:hypothetical protein